MDQAANPGLCIYQLSAIEKKNDKTQKVVSIFGMNILSITHHFYYSFDLL